MDKALVRCPYCVEDGNFKIMTKGGEGTWYVCDRCTHTVVPDAVSVSFRDYGVHEVERST